MLRSLFYSLATLAVLTVAFLFYWRMQPGTAVGGRAAAVAPLGPATAPSELTQLKIGPGENGWVNSFDDKGRLASQFKADEYAPQPDRSFKAVHPITVF